MQARKLSCLVIAVALLCGCVTPGAGGSTNVPDLSLKDLAGRRHYLRDTIGREVVVVSFWATWSLPCRQELLALEEIYQKNKDHSLKVLAISVDGPETQAGVRAFVKQHGFSFPVLFDTETRVSTIYNPKMQLPFLLLFNRRGRIVYTHTTFYPSEASKLRHKILLALEDR